MRYSYILFIVFFSCKENIQIINSNSANTNSKPVINAFVNAYDSLLIVNIQKMAPFNKPYIEDSLIIKNAQITVEVNDKVSLPLVINKKNEYFIKRPFLGGEKLFLEVHIGKETYSSTTVVPKAPFNIIYSKKSQKIFDIAWEVDSDTLHYYEVYKLYRKETENIYVENYLNEDNVLASISKKLKYDGEYKTTEILTEKEFGNKYSGEELEFVIYNSNANFYEYFSKNFTLTQKNTGSISSQKIIGNIPNAFGFFGAFNSIKVKVKI